jgi:hypothetical protein
MFDPFLSILAHTFVERGLVDNVTNVLINEIIPYHLVRDCNQNKFFGHKPFESAGGSKAVAFLLGLDNMHVSILPLLKSVSSDSVYRPER